MTNEAATTQAPGAKSLARKRRYFRDGTPAEEATSYLPWDLAQEIPELSAENPGGGGIYARLEEHGHILAEFTETVRARLATKTEAVALALSPGAPVIHLIREATDTAAPSSAASTPAANAAPCDTCSARSAARRPTAPRTAPSGSSRTTAPTGQAGPKA